MQQALPMMLTNLSRSLDPTQARTMHADTVTARNTFFCHLTCGFDLPDLMNRPFSMIRTAGNSCRGVDSRIASE